MRSATCQRGRVFGVLALLASVWLLAAGDDARAAGGTGTACGYNGYGQLGLGDYTNRVVFTTILAPTDIMALACGSYHSFAIASGGTLYACGDNTDGQLGLGDYNDRAFFTAVTYPTNVVAVDGGSSHSALVDGNAQLFVAGDNTDGQLGLGLTAGVDTFTLVPGLTLNASAASPVSCGWYHTAVIDSTGHVWTTGYNGYGQLGLNDYVDRDTFVQVPNLGPPTTPPIVGVYCGGYFTLALDSSGTLYGVGDNLSGEFGLATSTETTNFTAIMTDVYLVAAGGYHSIIATGSGTVYATGMNSDGQLGLGPGAVGTNQFGYTPVGSLWGVQSLAAGDYFSLAVDSTGNILGTGDNSDGQLGLGSYTSVSVFTQAVGVTRATTVSAGNYHSLALCDITPTVQMAASSLSVAENAGTTTVTVTLLPPTGNTVTVDYAVTGGTAILGTDYTFTPGTLTFSPGQSSRTFPVNIIDNALSQDNRTIILSLSSPANAQLGSPDTVVLTITDDDPLPTVAFVAAASASPENVPSPVIQVQLSAPAGRAIDVTCKATGGTAVAGSDYTLATTALRFPAGQTTAQLPLTVIDNKISNPSKTLILTLSAPRNATLGATSAHTLTIVDDEPPAVLFASAASSVSEATPTTTITVLLTRPLASAATVKYSVRGGTATGNGIDYTLAAGTLTFNPGETSKDILVSITNDNKPEPDETVIIGLSNAVNALLASPATHTLTLLDTSPPVLAVGSTGDLDFGNVGVGCQKLLAAAYTVRNAGGGTLHAKVSCSDPPFQVLDTKGVPVYVADFTIASGQTKSLTFSCVPYLLGPMARTITFSGEATNPSTTRTAKCAGVIAPKIGKFPARVPPGGTVTTEWTVEGGKPTHNDIHWATSLAALATNPNKTGQDLTLPYSTWFRVPATRCTVYFQAHAIVGGKSYLSEVKQVAVY